MRYSITFASGFVQMYKYFKSNNSQIW